MKNNYLLFVFLLLFFYSCKENEHSDVYEAVETPSVNSGKIKSEIEYDSNMNENRRKDYTYDNKGRQTGYKSYFNGQLSEEYRDYVYDDKELTFYQDSHYTYSCKKTYYDDNWSHPSSYRISLGGIYSASYQYNENGHITYYSENAPSGTINRKEYVFNGKEVTYVNYDRTYNCTPDPDDEEYIDDVYITRHKIIYYDDALTKVKEKIDYDADMNELCRYEYEYEYDSEGRETGYMYYYSGNLRTKYRDYTYKEKELTFYQDDYGNSESVSSTVKHKKIYY